VLHDLQLSSLVAAVHSDLCILMEKMVLPTSGHDELPLGNLYCIPRRSAFTSAVHNNHHIFRTAEKLQLLCYHFL